MVDYKKYNTLIKKVWTAERLLFGGPNFKSNIKFEPRTLHSVHMYSS